MGDAKGPLRRVYRCSVKDCDYMAHVKVNEFGSKFYYSFCDAHLRAAEVGPYSPKLPPVGTEYDDW